MTFGEYGKVEEPEDAYGVTYLGPYVTAASERAGYPSPGKLNHPTDVAVDPDGDIYVTDWGNHRVCVFDSEGKPIAQLIGDAHVLSKWGQQTVSANPDMEKARRRVKSLEPQWRFLLPDGGGVRSGNRQHHRCRQPAQSAAGLQKGSRLQRLPGEPVGAVRPRRFPASSAALRRRRREAAAGIGRPNGYAPSIGDRVQRDRLFLCARRSMLRKSTGRLATTRRSPADTAMMPALGRSSAPDADRGCQIPYRPGPRAPLLPPSGD